MLAYSNLPKSQELWPVRLKDLLKSELLNYWHNPSHLQNWGELVLGQTHFDISKPSHDLKKRLKSPIFQNKKMGLIWASGLFRKKKSWKTCQCQCMRLSILYQFFLSKNVWTKLMRIKSNKRIKIWISQ